MRGPDGRRKAPYKVVVGRAGFEAAHAYLQSLFPDLGPQDFLVGLEFAGYHGYNFAQFLTRLGYHVMSVHPAHTKRLKEVEDNSPLKSDDQDARLICKLVGDGLFVPFPLLASPHTELKLLVVQRHRLTSSRPASRIASTQSSTWHGRSSCRSSRT